MQLKHEKPEGRLLDFGCGSGNNLKFFIDYGYDALGVDIGDDWLSLAEENGCPPASLCKLNGSLPSGPFDIIVSNQVLYFLGQPDDIRSKCKDLNDQLAADGLVFFTMIGPRNYYIADGHAKQREDGLYEMRIGEGHRLAGFHQIYHVVQSEDELRTLFDMFECISVGYFDQSMLGMKSNFHWIFIGRKK